MPVVLGADGPGRSCVPEDELNPVANEPESSEFDDDLDDDDLDDESEDLHEEPQGVELRVDEVDDKITHLLRGEVEVEGRMPYSSNATFLVHVHHDGRSHPAIYKPMREIGRAHV